MKNITKTPAAGILALSLAGCGSNDAATTETTAPAEAGGTLSVMCTANPHGDILEAAKHAAQVYTQDNWHYLDKGDHDTRALANKDNVWAYGENVDARRDNFPIKNMDDLKHALWLNLREGLFNDGSAFGYAIRINGIRSLEEGGHEASITISLA